MTYYEEFINGHLVLPTELLQKFKFLFRSADDFLVWLYFLDEKEMAPSLIAERTDKTLNEVNSSIQKLQKESLLKVTLIELDGQTDMIFDVSPAFQKLDQLSQPQQESEKEAKGNVLQTMLSAFESEMGMISPMQLEEIRAWLEIDKYDSGLILAALREASMNKKLSLNYIRAILRNWRLEGLHTVRDIEEKRSQREISIQEKRASEKGPSHSFTIPIEGPWSQPHD